MRIERTAWQNNQFFNAEEAGGYARAREIQDNFHHVAKDIAQLDNSSLDHNATPGFIVLTQACLSRSPQNPAGPVEATVEQIERAQFTGELTLDTNNNPTTLTMEVGSEFPYITAHHSKGFLGLGQDRLVVEQAEFGCSFAEVATFFADGTVDYDIKRISPWD